MVGYIESKKIYILSYNSLIALLLLFRIMQIYTGIQFLYEYLYIYSSGLVKLSVSIIKSIIRMTQPITPTYLLTFRAHSLNSKTIIASYAFGTGNHFQTGSKVFQEISSLKRAKLEILNQALIAMGDGKKVNIETDEKFILDFFKSGIMKVEKSCQDAVNDLRINLSLCSSVVYQSYIYPGLFNAALQEYKKAKAAFIPPMPSYKELFAAQKRLREARQYEAAISTW